MSVLTRGEYTISPLADGAAGRGVSSVVSQYAVSTSKTTAPSDASFSTNRPTWEPGKYVWTRSLITYTSGSPATSTTTPVVSSEWEAVNEVQVGGRNLALKSKYARVDTISAKSVSGYGFVIPATTSGNVAEISNLILNPSQIYTLSYTYWCESGTVRFSNDLYPDNLPDNGTTTATTTPQKMVWTFSSASVDMTQADIRFWTFNANPSTGGPTSAVYITDIKLENGNKATDWIPAPEDVDDSIDGVAENVNTTNEALNGLDAAQVDRLKQIKTAIDQLDAALGTAQSDITNGNTAQEYAIDQINAAIGELKSEAKKINDGVTGLQDNKVTTDQYIRLGLLYVDDKNIPRHGVAIGENLTTVTDGQGRVVLERRALSTTITSDRISFWRNGRETLYISEDKVVIVRLAMGPWETNTDYGWTLLYKGVS